MDGWQVARRLREQGRARDLAPMLLVAVTVCGREEDYRRSAAAGIDRHLVKPVDPEVIRRLLKRHALGPALQRPGVKSWQRLVGQERK